MEKNLDKMLYIKEDLMEERKELRKKIYEKIINFKYIGNLFLFEKIEKLFQKEENENEDKNEIEEFKKLLNNYRNINNLIYTINDFSNDLPVNSYEKILDLKKDSMKEKNELRKKIYEKIIKFEYFNIKLFKNEVFIFHELENKLYPEDIGQEENEEFRKLVNKYRNVNYLMDSFNDFLNELKSRK